MRIKLKRNKISTKTHQRLVDSETRIREFNAKLLIWYTYKIVKYDTK